MKLTPRERAALRKSVGLPLGSGVRISLLTGDGAKAAGPMLQGLPAHWVDRSQPGKMLVAPLYHDLEAQVGQYRLMTVEGGRIVRGALVNLPRRTAEYKASTWCVSVGVFWVKVWRDWQEETGNQQRPDLFFQ